MQSLCRSVVVLLAAGCQSLAVQDLSVTVSDDVVTVGTVTFSTNKAAVATVEYGVDGAFTLLTPAEGEETKTHAIPLVGVPAEREVSYRILVDGVPIEGGEGTFTTGALPAGIPEVTVEGEPYEGFVFTSVNGDIGNWIVMIDPNGQVVWYHSDRRGLSLFRALSAHDGRGVVFSSAIQAGGPAETSMIVRVPWAGGAEVEHVVPNLAHDFVELADGTVVSLAYHEQDGIDGNSLLSIDADGQTTELWNTWDCYDPEDDLGDDPSQGWTHANALDVLDDGSYLVGLRNFGTIVKVEGRDCAWGFGGPNGTVSLTGGRFIHQHQFEFTGSSMLVFDNDGLGGDPPESRAVEYTFDGTGDNATVLREFRADPPEYSFIMGDTYRLADEETFVLYAVPRMMDIYKSDGARKTRMTLTGGGPLGFAQLLATPYEEAQ